MGDGGGEKKKRRGDWRRWVSEKRDEGRLERGTGGRRGDVM